MSEFRFHQPSVIEDVKRNAWEPFLVPKEVLDEQAMALAKGPMPASGFRSVSIVHPRANDGIPSFTPVTEITLNVLNPGEKTPLRRGNYSLLETLISGHGTAHVGDGFDVSLHDVWTVPSMKAYQHENNSDGMMVWLTYSNAALLRRIGSYWADPSPEPARPPVVSAETADLESRYNRKTGPAYVLPTTGAHLRGYEYLTDIEPVPNPPLHWAWQDMEPYLPMRRGDNNDPKKRNIWLMYNPATERRQGTTPAYFATYGGAAPGTPPYAGKRGHFHTSASINYHTRGFGYSIVDGKRIDWKAGDLLFSAPSWLEHAHYTGEEGWTVLTVQDHPLQISLGSLLWQENPDQQIFSLGNEEGQKGYVAPREGGK
jgi:gentisate 1,2-dioxygenase